MQGPLNPEKEHPNAKTLRELAERAIKSGPGVFKLTPEEVKAILWASLLVDGLNSHLKVVPK